MPASDSPNQASPQEPAVLSAVLQRYLGKVVVVDVEAPYVYIGTLVRYDGHFLELRDADVHDLRDSTSTRELYVLESSQYGVRRNRRAVQIRTEKIVSISLLSDVTDR